MFQDPADPGAPTLLEHVLSATQAARGGGGAFAWASTAGVELLLEDPLFTGFLGRGPFDLVIGVDAITDPTTLTRLASLAGSHAQLEVSAFLHGRSGALFHPKVCWFVRESGGVALAGSGNLTVGGLTKTGRPSPASTSPQQVLAPWRRSGGSGSCATLWNSAAWMTRQ